jgi:hypothetical protein
VVLEAKARESTTRQYDHLGAVVRRKMGRNIAELRSDEDSSEEKQVKWVKLSETMW